MAISTLTSHAEIRHPGTDRDDPPDILIPSADVSSMKISRRGKDRKCDGTLTLYNDAGAYTTDATGSLLRTPERIHSGDAVAFYVAFEGDPMAFGGGAFGDGGFGGDHHRFEGVVREVEYTQSGPVTSLITLELESFVGGVLGKRTVTETWRERQVSGTPTSIVNSVLRNHAPEIDRSRIATITDTVSYTADGTPILKLLQDIATRVDATMWSDYQSLVFRPEGETGVYQTVSADDFTTHTVRESDIQLANSIRVDGAEDAAVDETNPSTLDTTTNPYEDGGVAYTPDSYTTVTQSSRLTFRLDTRKARVQKLELWTRLTGSGENILVRLQRDDGTGTGPIAPNSTSSDITSKQLGGDDELFVDDDGWTTFIMPDHTLPEPSPWVIVETDGDTGQDIGIDAGDSNPAHINWYPFQLSIRQTDAASRQLYRRREFNITRDNIATLEEATQLGNELLAKHSVPKRTITMEPTSLAAHEIMVTDGVQVTWAQREGVPTHNPTYMFERVDSFDGSTLTTQLTGQYICDCDTGDLP